MGSLGFDLGSVFVKAVALDGQGRMVHALYRKRNHEDRPALRAFLEEVGGLCPGMTFQLGITGGEATLSRATHLNGILAVAAGVRHLHPDTRSVIEVGGQTAKYIELNASGDLRDFAINEACAAGTGAFLEHQARRLGFSAADLSGLALEARRAATIAGRCSVFAATDMIHLQQKGTPLPEIAYGLCTAIVRNYLSALLKGREVAFPVTLAGGCAHNLGILRAFRELLGPAATMQMRVSEHPGLEGAIGAATSAGINPELHLTEIQDLLEVLTADLRNRPQGFAPLQPPTSRSGSSEPVGGGAGPAEGYLGIDVGSVSTDLVVLDRAGELIASVYLPTQGRPADVLLQGLALLDERFGSRLRVLACGATGSGRYLAARLAGADVVKNEITCQLLGAKHSVSDVDTIFEIGGQDSKFISARDGSLVDFAMNKVCAAGTGSFLEERSRDLGIDVRLDFAARALASKSPLDLGSRCTVFMETEVVNALARGAAVEDICAGLAYAIAKNYLDKVVGTRPLGRCILFQGGVASNKAVVAAFEGVLGQSVHVHPYNRISGAIGAALAARAHGAGPTVFKGFRVSSLPRLSTFECQHCSNRCEVNVIEMGQDRTFFGDTCERYTSGESARSQRVPNLAAEYLDRCGAFFGTGAGLRIGVPRASSLMGQLPFWGTFWKELGHRPVLSRSSAQETLAMGLRHLAVGVCLPIKLIAGHVHALLAEDLDVVFVPAVVRLPGEEPSQAFGCPYTMAAPFLLDVPDQSRCLTPVIQFGQEEAFAAAFDPYLDMLSATRDQVRHAYRIAMQAQADFLETFRRRAAGLLEAGAYRHAFGILGRPYCLLDSFLNLGLFERLARFDVLALPMDLLPAEIRNSAADSPLPWYYPYDMHRLSSVLAQSGRIHPVILTSYGCGPDAFALQQMNEQLKGRPHLVLELDEHRGEAGLVTRIEAFLDQLEGASQAPARPMAAVTSDRAFFPASPATIWIPYFADHAYAYSGLLRHLGHEAHVLPLPTPEVRALGERYTLGKECHAYSMILGDLLQVAFRKDPQPSVFFFPGTSIPCLLHEYGRGMQALLRELDIQHVQVSAPRGKELVERAGIKAIEYFYTGLLAIELLVKAVCQIRPYELQPGVTDTVHRKNLERIEGAIARGEVLEALDASLHDLAGIPMTPERDRPVVGLVGDVYTRVNPAANQELVRWLEAQGLEVWPSPFQVDLLDFGISRNLYLSLSSLALPNLLANGSIALLRAIHLWRVRTVVGSRVARREEPSYLELKRLAAPYMPNEAHALLFLQVAKTVDFARSGVNGIANAICFGCMVGNAAAAVNERIRRDFDNVPILTAVYTGSDDPSRRMALEAFVSQVKAHHRRQGQEGRRRSSLSADLRAFFTQPEGISRRTPFRRLP